MTKNKNKKTHSKFSNSKHDSNTFNKEQLNNIYDTDKDLDDFIEKFENNKLNVQDIIKELENESTAILTSDEELNAPHPEPRRSSLSKRKKKMNNDVSNKRTKKKKPTKKKRRILRYFLLFCVAVLVCIIGYSSYCIITAPSIDTDNIYSTLQVNSTLYDDSGKPVDNVFSDENRSLVKYKDLPKDLINAFVAIEDKTFWSHCGFNFIRIMGAIKDSILGGGNISGTSTITQQLARNIYLAEEKSERSIRRKIVEAYYTIQLEHNLSKEEIITAYLNTISLGFHSYGVQTASKAYFDCDVKDLSLEQCAALAALPQAPTEYALVVECDNSQVEKEDVVLKKGGTTSFVLNDSSKDRRETCLDLMLEQKLISKEKHDKAVAVPLEKMINPNFSSTGEAPANYFAEYILNQVIKDLENEGYDSESATRKVYSGGLKIYTTMDKKAQDVIKEEFDNPDNFPGVSSYNSDNDGNIVNENGAIILYDYDNLFDDDGTFTFNDDEYRINKDGSITIYYGNRLNIYKTVSNGDTDYNLEFKNMFFIENGRFFSVAGGYINIPAKYKTVDDDMNLTVSADFLKEYDEFFDTEDGLSIPDASYTLNQKVVQPQAAMVVRDVNNGQIKAMVGGRELTGEQLFNRATTTRQPGSSIKPLSVYSASLQYSADAVANGEKDLTFNDPGGSTQGDRYWGNFLTAASLVIDEPLTVNGELWPKNSNNSYSGNISMRTALKNSVNVSAVKLYQQIGPEYSSEQVKKFGITSLVTDTNESVNDMNAAALALGGLSNGVSPLEMSNAYTAFVNGGKVYESSCYTKVEDSLGKVILEKENPKSSQALDPGVAWITRDMMFGVVSEGTGTGASIDGVQVGGKTGTTSNQYDIWFDGFTPTYSASLWIGNDMNMELTSMSEYAAALWGRIMSQVPKACEGEYSDAPNDVISLSVDAQNGYLPNGGSTKLEYFIKGTQPTSTSDYYYIEDKDEKIKVCAQSGYLITPDCTHYELKDADKIGDKAKYYCPIHNPNPKKYPIDTGNKDNDNGKEKNDKNVDPKNSKDSRDEKSGKDDSEQIDKNKEIPDEKD